LDSVKLEDRASVLSGGQVQLLALAQAILNQNDCSILLLDEPTSHIDSKSQARVLESVFEAAKSKG
jgi:ABC-type transport system involved in cytochrome bd biosynthesis fused ATPase/permease subunit